MERGFLQHAALFENSVLPTRGDSEVLEVAEPAEPHSLDGGEDPALEHLAVHADELPADVELVPDGKHPQVQLKGELRLCESGNN